MAKEYTTSQALEQAIGSMAGDRAIDVAFRVEAMQDLGREIEKQMKPLREQAVKEARKVIEQQKSLLKSLGASSKGRTPGSKNKPKTEAQAG